ncbi:hypothetical protein IWW50_000507 [Coemansia erecta]|nr:hypothetical protein IWW50_000507 [Coemansia erecta]
MASDLAAQPLSTTHHTSTLKAAASDVTEASNNTVPLVLPQPNDSKESIVDPVERLVDSVRNIRAMTDEVMGARERIDEILEHARDLNVTVSTKNILTQ